MHADHATPNHPNKNTPNYCDDDNDSSDETETDTQPMPTSIDEWMHRPASFVFADSTRTMLVWDTEEGGGIITKHGIGEMPLKHAESVITMLMKTVETLTRGGAQPNSPPSKRMRKH